MPPGPNANGFEKDLEAFVNSPSTGIGTTKQVVALSASTADVHLGFLACGVGSAEEYVKYFIDSIRSAKVG